MANSTTEQSYTSLRNVLLHKQDGKNVISVDPVEDNRPPPSDHSNVSTPKPFTVAHRTRARLPSTSQTASASSSIQILTES